MKHSIPLRALLGLCLCVGFQSAAALTYEEFLIEKEKIRINEQREIEGGQSNNTLEQIRRTSDLMVRERYDEFLTDAILNGTALLGTPILNGERVVAHVANGVPALLQFQFFDGDALSLTGLAGLISAGVARVEYTVNLDPVLADLRAIALYNVVIGSSTDRNSFFSLGYVPSGFEDDIFATPYDANGNVIVFASRGGNVATGTIVNIFSVPEPPGIVLLAAGLLLAARAARRTRATAGTPPKGRVPPRYR